MNPTSASVHVDRPLTNLTIGYRNANYIADGHFPIVPVKKQSDIVPKYDKSHWFRNVATLRAPGTKSRGSGFTVDTSDTYYCPRYSFRFELPDETKDNADIPFNLERDGAEFVVDKMQLCREVLFATAWFITGVWDRSNTLSGTDQWDDYAGSSPLVDIETEKVTMEGKILNEANNFTMGREVWAQLKWHPDVLDTIKYTRTAIATTTLFGQLIEIPNIKIGKAMYTTSVEGTAEGSVSYTRLWGKNCLMLYSPGRPSIMKPAAGYTFVWQRVPNAIQYIKRMRDEEKEISIIEGNSYFSLKQTASEAGMVIVSAVS